MANRMAVWALVPYSPPISLKTALAFFISLSTVSPRVRGLSLPVLAADYGQAVRCRFNFYGLNTLYVFCFQSIYLDHDLTPSNGSPRYLITSATLKSATALRKADTKGFSLV